MQKWTLEKHNILQQRKREPTKWEDTVITIIMHNAT